MSKQQELAHKQTLSNVQNNFLNQHNTNNQLTAQIVSATTLY